MIDYQTKKLGEVIELHYGKGIDKSHRKSDGEFPIFGANGELGRTDEFIAEGEAIIVGRKGSAGEVIRISGKFWASDVTYYVFGNDQIDIDYLFYFFKSIDLTQYARGVKPGINRNDVYQIEIPLPPLNIQKKIVARLDELLGNVAEAKRLREEAIADTDKILSQTLREIFEKGKEKGWEEKELGKILVLNYGKGLSKDERSENGTYFVYGANGPLGKSDKFLVEGEGIIVGRKGSAGELTRVSGKYWPTDVTYFITENEFYNIDFIFYLLKSLNLTGYAKGVKPGINRNEVYALKIFMPNLKTQKQIVTRLDKLSAQLRELRELQQSQLDDLKKLEKAYLREAFRGELI